MDMHAIAVHIVLVQGKVSSWNEDRSKEFFMNTKLNDKSLAALGGSDAALDMGLATPLSVDAKGIVKAEMPSADKVHEVLKNCKST